MKPPEKSFLGVSHVFDSFTVISNQLVRRTEITGERIHPHTLVTYYRFHGDRRLGCGIYPFHPAL